MSTHYDVGYSHSIGVACYPYCSSTSCVPRDVSCALCPETDLAGEPVVASSGGTQGVPRFCGFQANATAPVSPTTICFYGVQCGSLSYASTELCPLVTELYSPVPLCLRGLWNFSCLVYMLDG
ncbi:hypothetical protein BDZ89DRAFT_1019199 [Hymenopellis radicata]|nr:hypothetical protein BDZ89DRAFT_1019199 [Hymenopellis radicata]